MDSEIIDMSQVQQQQQEEDSTLDTKLRDKLGPEMYEVVKALAIILGFKTFEDYVAHCIKQNAEMFIEGGDLISDYFCDAYKHLARGPRRGLDSEKERGEGQSLKENLTNHAIKKQKFESSEGVRKLG